MLRLCPFLMVSLECAYMFITIPEFSHCLPTLTQGKVSRYAMEIFRETSNAIIPTGRMVGEMPDWIRDSIVRSRGRRDQQGPNLKDFAPHVSLGLLLDRTGSHWWSTTLGGEAGYAGGR